MAARPWESHVFDNNSVSEDVFNGCSLRVFFRNVASPVEMSEYEPKQKKMTSQAKESFAPLLGSSECKLDTKQEIAKLCLTQVLFCQLETATVTATGTLLLCIIQPARGLCSWADLFTLTAGCEKEEPEEDGHSNGQRCRRISTNQYVYICCSYRSAREGNDDQVGGIGDEKDGCWLSVSAFTVLIHWNWEAKNLDGL
jgi:hypothetical protein